MLLGFLNYLVLFLVMNSLLFGTTAQLQPFLDFILGSNA